MCSRGRVAVALLAAAVALTACGKKGDPLPPLLPIPAAAEDLTVQQRGSELILRFGYPRTTAAGMPLDAIERIEVYELVRPALERPAAEPEAAEGSLEAVPAEVDPVAPGPDATATVPDEDTPAEEVAAGELDERPDAEVGESAPETIAAPGGPRWLAPPVDAREFGGAATPVLTLSGDRLAGALRGDRIVVSLPLDPPASEAGEAAPPNARYYAVRTVAEGDFESALSNRAGIVPQIPPPAPGELIADPRADGVEIGWQWDDGVAIAGFDVYRRLATERDFGEPLELVGPQQRSYLDAGARYGQRYLYAVTAVAQRSPLIESAVAAAREVDYRDVFPPPVPASVVALADAGAVRLVWDESRAPDLAGYHVYRRQGGGDWRRLTAEPIDRVELTDRDVAAGETYAYRVTAVDELGNESDPSPPAETLVR